MSARRAPRLGRPLLGHGHARGLERGAHARHPRDRGGVVAIAARIRTRVSRASPDGRIDGRAVPAIRSRPGGQPAEVLREPSPRRRNRRDEVAAARGRRELSEPSGPADVFLVRRSPRRRGERARDASSPPVRAASLVPPVRGHPRGEVRHRSNPVERLPRQRFHRELVAADHLDASDGVSGDDDQRVPLQVDRARGLAFD
mmetsp:Transcript_7909/g.28896  ORF Transcript_7909/g.28896 Transcript_7909/m.28896 type:complete len:201 (+) Transcript_7909:313-915(+)